MRRLPIVNSDCRLPFEYIEHAKVLVKNGNVVALSETGTEQINCALHGALLLGPGSSITHEAVVTINAANCIIQWCGNDGLSMYSATLSSTYSMRNAATQINKIASNRFKLWNKMLQMRPEIDPFIPTNKWRELLLIEAASMKKLYEAESRKYGLIWNGRIAKFKDMPEADTVNRTLTLCNCALYSIATSVILARGFIPTVAVIHASGATPMAYDLADMVKAKSSIPFAMQFSNSFSSVKDMYVAFKTYLADCKIMETLNTTLLQIFE